MKTFDERLFELKMQPINQRMHKDAGKCWARARDKVRRLGNHAALLPTYVECHLEVLRKYLEELYKLRREVWLLDGNTVTPEFIRKTVVPHAFNVIAARKGAIQFDLDLTVRRTGEHQQGAHILVSQMNQLLGEVANRYEIEAIELEKREAAARPVTQAPTPAMRNGMSWDEQRRNHIRKLEEAETWRDFHNKFMQLASEEAGIVGAEKKDLYLGAHCDYGKHPEIWAERGQPGQGLFCLLQPPETGLWMLGDGVSENFQARFRALATRAGVALGRPKNTDTEDFWFHRLYLDLLENNSDQLFAASKEGGMILRVCVASATFCSRLEKRALEQLEIGSTGAERLRSGTNQAESSYVQNGAKSMQGVESNSTKRAAAIRRNITRLRKECGWSFDQLAEETGIDKKSILSHVKRRNVKEYLPENCQKDYDRRMRNAYAMNNYTEAKEALQKIFRQLERINPSAARSLEEGLEETLTVHRLGIGAVLRRKLATTNPIESCLSTVQRVARNVKRWREGDQPLRWTATGLWEAEKKFRRIKGYQEILLLKERLNPSRLPQKEVRTVEVA